MPITIHRVADRTPAQAAALKTLCDAVYPPEIAAQWPGRSIDWSGAEWAAVWSDDSGAALCQAGIIVRDAVANGAPVRTGGLGSVRTHPDHRRRGIARATIAVALEFLREQGLDFALLVCETSMIPFYEGLGWWVHRGPLIVRQFGQVATFTFNVPMVYPLRTVVPAAGGTIDLLGPPW